MEYKIEKTEDTPEIELSNDKLTITGRSLPENVTSFYGQLLKDVEGKTNFTVNVKLEYFNTATSKILLDLFYLLEDKTNLINWYYDQDDEDMFDAGVEYSELLDIKFNFLIFT